jgi:hypothetical protein
VTFFQTVDGTTPGQEFLSVFAPGETRFEGRVGFVVPLESLRTDEPGVTVLSITPAPVITTGANPIAETFSIHTIFDQEYHDPVVLESHAALKAGLVSGAPTGTADITFFQTVNGDGAGPWNLYVDADRFVTFEMNVGVVNRLQDLVVRTGGRHTGPFTIDVEVRVTRDIDVWVRESAMTSADDDVMLEPTARFIAGGDVYLKAGDDVTIASANVAAAVMIDATGMLKIDGDFADDTRPAVAMFIDNDAFGTTIRTTAATPTTPMPVDAVGVLRAVGGIVIRGGDDEIAPTEGADFIRLQIDRFDTPGAIDIRGFQRRPADSGVDEFFLVFRSNFTLSAGVLLVQGGDEMFPPGVDGDDRTIFEFSKDTAAMNRKIHVSYAPDPPIDVNNPPQVIDGSDSNITGFGTTVVGARGMEKYEFRAGAGIHDHFFVKAADIDLSGLPNPLPANHPIRNLEQEILVTNNRNHAVPPVMPVPPGQAIPDYNSLDAQFLIQGFDGLPQTFESLQLTGSNVRDVIVNDTNLPTLIEGGAGNDTLIGGSSLDVIFSGAGATPTASGPIMFNVGAVDEVILVPMGASAATVRNGDVLIGAGGSDFLFADVDLFIDPLFAGGPLWGLVTLDVPGESDLIEGAGQLSSLAGTRNHAAQFGVTDVVRNITGMLIDGGAIKDVMTWLKVTPMTADLTPQMTSFNLNMLIRQAFFENNLDPAVSKVGLTQPPFNALFEDFVIVQRTIPPPPPSMAAAPVAAASASAVASPAAVSSSAPKQVASIAKPSAGVGASSLGGLDAVFWQWGA